MPPISAELWALLEEVSYLQDDARAPGSPDDANGHRHCSLGPVHTYLAIDALSIMIARHIVRLSATTVTIFAMAAYLQLSNLIETQAASLSDPSMRHNLRNALHTSTHDFLYHPLSNDDISNEQEDDADPSTSSHRRYVPSQGEPAQSRRTGGGWRVCPPPAHLALCRVNSPGRMARIDDQAGKLLSHAFTRDAITSFKQQRHWQRGRAPRRLFPSEGIGIHDSDVRSSSIDTLDQELVQGLPPTDEVETPAATLPSTPSHVAPWPPIQGESPEDAYTRLPPRRHHRFASARFSTTSSRWSTSSTLFSPTAQDGDSKAWALASPRQSNILGLRSDGDDSQRGTVSEDGEQAESTTKYMQCTT